MDTPVKEYIFLKEYRPKTCRKCWTLWRYKNLQIIGIDEGKEAQFKGTENIFNKIIEQRLQNLKKEVPIKVQETHWRPNRLDQESPFST